ncbi:succinate-semialdehyde dehydrogenase/glutarate-semialdehyde dehydrogenase [Pullulanibacillus pueri]|uniref:NAD-dependent succinate-semialdehyde dehydrogenase n=1 Tax=Pullulanibacillus pueri TaxID=1437324 RepID=A0A8J2ZY42_9BACL|nr:NAD-dependent succinate-semialdehyde dehydrogenase [Pullulanibacillus pueri]MBM7680544.1 succinate-semialdehyde dehydrogenase/glutarate-semialdehyde dehydrogenase [Pullulanibacillus pueri]GGH86175.1 NAD-dependent succinate-semialdehyde dehydrogenase [Pullulanibacillus pueri]
MEKLNLLNYIDGEWVGDALEKIEVTDPATGNVIGSVPNGGEDETKQAIEAAHRALPMWSKMTASDRADILRQYFNIILKHKDELAEIMTLENGKPLKESLGEVAYAASFIEWFAEEGKRVYGRIVPGKREDHRIQVIKQPVGVVAAITPWNFPAAMITRKLAPALASGCTFIVKPPEQTPLTALKLMEYAEQAGIPKGVVNVVCGNPESFTNVIMADMRVRKITFTGSTEVGRLLMKKSAEHIKKISLELGGHAPVIVCDDADLDKAVEMIMASKFRNSGQTCVCANRLYVQAGIYDTFVEKMTAEVKKLKYGNGFDSDVEVGPLIDKDGYEKVERQVKDAIEKGAKCLVGGEGQADDQKGTYFFAPTLLANMNEDMEMMHIETFGPIAPIQKYETDEEAIRLANDTPYGLAAYFYTQDVSRGTKIAEGLDYGIVGWNDGIPSTAQAPFGGTKQSGLGREGGKEGIEEYLETKYISLSL